MNGILKIKKAIGYLFMALALITAFGPQNAAGRMAANGFAAYAAVPPANNPHPPESDSDKRRVAFAESAIQKLLFTKQTSVIPHAYKYPVTGQFKISAACLKQEDCALKTPGLNVFLERFKQSSGLVTEFKHTHIIPWSYKQFLNNRMPHGGSIQVTIPSKKSQSEYDPRSVMPMPSPSVASDEFLIHSYVKTQNGKWHHLDVIVNESAAGTLELRGFYLIPIPAANKGLPPGAVC